VLLSETAATDPKTDCFKRKTNVFSKIHNSNFRQNIGYIVRDFCPFFQSPQKKRWKNISNNELFIASSPGLCDYHFTNNATIPNWKLYTIPGVANMRSFDIRTLSGNLGKSRALMK
jgi:hypothetical protein